MATILISIALWRITRLFVYDDGPYAVFEDLRVSLRGKPWINIDCMACMGLWVAFPAVFVDILLWPVLAGLIMIIEAVYERLD